MHCRASAYWLVRLDRTPALLRRDGRQRLSGSVAAARPIDRFDGLSRERQSGLNRPSAMTYMRKLLPGCGKSDCHRWARYRRKRQRAQMAGPAREMPSEAVTLDCPPPAELSHCPFATSLTRARRKPPPFPIAPSVQAQHRTAHR